MGAGSRDALRGRVAVVAGATRGAGRGIAAALGEAGATVICTGRSSVTGNARSDYDRPETIEETAELVTELGGVGIPIQVDHLDIAQVRALADRIRTDHGAIDILVNDIWGAEMLKGPPPTWNRPMWEHDLDDGLRILRLGVDTHLITSHCLLPMLVARPGGLLVEVTDGTVEYNARQLPACRCSTTWRRSAVNRLAFSHGHELEPFGATAVAVTPGWLRSEMMLDNWGVTEDNWQARAGPEPVRRLPHRAPGVRRIRDAAICRPRYRRDRRRRGPCAVEPALGQLGRSWPASTASPTSTAGSRTAGA